MFLSFVSDFDWSIGKNNGFYTLIKTQAYDYLIFVLISQCSDSVNNTNELYCWVPDIVFTSLIIFKHVESSFENLTQYVGASSKQREDSKK